MGVIRNHIATSVNLEAIGGIEVRPPSISTQALSPSPGSVQQAPPNVTRLIGVDYQLANISVNLTANTLQAFSWPTISFTGLMSSAQRYNTGTSANNALPSISLSPTTSKGMVAGQSTQFLLICNVQNLPIGSGGVMSSFNIATTAKTTSNTTPTINGPWFPTGVTYTAFSCTVTANFYSLVTASFVPATIGVTAQLYSIYVQ